MRRILGLAALLLALGGCGSATSIDTRALVVGIAVDKGQKPGLLRYTFQVPSPQSLGGGGGGGGSGGNKFYYPSADAHSLAEAISSVEDRTSRDIYLGQLHIILVALDVPPTLRDAFGREEQRIGELDHTEWVALSQPPAAKMLEPPSSQEELPSMFYSTHFNCRTCQSTALGVPAWKAAKEELEPGTTVTLPVVRTQDGQYDIGTVASFNTGQPAVEFTRPESESIMLALGQMYKGVVRSETPLGPAVVRSLRSNATKRGEVGADGVAHLYLEVRLSGVLAQIPPKADRVTADVSRMIAQATAASLRTQFAATVRKAQSAGVDPFRFGEALYQHDAARTARLAQWPAEFRRATVQMRTEVTVPREGVTV